MPKYKKVNSTLPLKENISCIFDEIKNDENAKKIKKNISNKLNELKKDNDKKEKKNKKKETKKKSKDSTKSQISTESQMSTKSQISTESNEINHQKIKEKNKIKMEKLAVIESLCEEYPCLKKDKDKIIKKHLEETKLIINPFVQNDYTLEKIILNNKILYIDNYNNILDESTKLIGFYKDLKSNYEFILFPTKSKNTFK